MKGKKQHLLFWMVGGMVIKPSRTLYTMLILLLLILCIRNYPNCELKTFGEYVGLPKGQMGNSEVGHLNIGAGRIVYQDLAKINIACEG